jgi:hypothetical protein
MLLCLCETKKSALKQTRTRSTTSTLRRGYWAKLSPTWPRDCLPPSPVGVPSRKSDSDSADWLRAHLALVASPSSQPIEQARLQRAPHPSYRRKLPWLVISAGCWHVSILICWRCSKRCIVCIPTQLSVPRFAVATRTAEWEYRCSTGSLATPQV